MASEEVLGYTRRLVDQIRAHGVSLSPCVESAFLAVPRHLLLDGFCLFRGLRKLEEVRFDRRSPDPNHLELVYSDQALATQLRGGRAISSSSQPSLMVLMIESLEIGTGSGYNAALFADITRSLQRVTTVDIRQATVERARERLSEAGYVGIAVICRDGFEGAPERAPLDRIGATFACGDLSPRWLEQLRPGGVVLLPLTHGGWSPLVRVRREAAPVRGKAVAPSRFVFVAGLPRRGGGGKEAPASPGASPSRRPHARRAGGSKRATADYREGGTYGEQEAGARGPLPEEAQGDLQRWGLGAAHRVVRPRLGEG